MTKLKVKYLVFHTVANIRNSNHEAKKLLVQNGFLEISDPQNTSLVLKPSDDTEFFVYIHERSGGYGNFLSLVRDNHHTGLIVDSGKVIGYLNYNGSGHQILVEGKVLKGWKLVCHLAPFVGNAQDFRFFLGSHHARML